MALALPSCIDREDAFLVWFENGTNVPVIVAVAHRTDGPLDPSQYLIGPGEVAELPAAYIHPTEALNTGDLVVFDGKCQRLATEALGPGRYDAVLGTDGSLEVKPFDDPARDGSGPAPSQSRVSCEVIIDQGATGRESRLPADSACISSAGSPCRRSPGRRRAITYRRRDQGLSFACRTNSRT